MNILFTRDAWADYLLLQDSDPAVAERINLLISDIQRTPFTGLGKPEPLCRNLTAGGLGGSAASTGSSIASSGRAKGSASKSWRADFIIRGIDGRRRCGFIGRMALRTEDFAFDLPRELIAERPAEPRESARLLVVPRNGGLLDRHIADLPGLLRPGDLLVCNDTKVIPARLNGRRGEARVEVTLARNLGGGLWRAYAKGARRLKPGASIEFAAGFAAEVAGKEPGGEVLLRFALDEDGLRAALDRHGAMPLPPYIRRPPGGDPGDRRDYQTMFARREGAVAAPTAGLHFTPALLEAMAARGIECAALTLHVGPGTFLPVKTDEPERHPMHAEWGTIDAAAAARINEARAGGGRIVAVGTTSLRLLESAADETGAISPFCGETRLFILPGYRFRAIDLLLTNFHLPRSTLLMLVAALAGLDRIQAAYAHAVAQRYRFFSYGDACLIEAPAA